ncbi:hypothetical protein HW450_09360 [Corynebacterium hindlerae]|uniref:Uncharacterized protein n=1 Tax=Corynebacterium hindlerae TaxID=699041 RepID=A0A7G5FD74_9CORY|nr:hypothetical protein [Corynebacterium hindlerae]QMV84565.1 hypothetical protein HW450_09360 [Corynebacterium hindlerae]
MLSAELITSTADFAIDLFQPILTLGETLKPLGNVASAIASIAKVFGLK